MWHYNKLLIIFEFIQIISNFDITCRNEQGHPVDWFYVYKFPMDYSSTLGYLQQSNRSGLEYMYLDSAAPENGWKISKYTIMEKNSFLGQTISELMNLTNILLLAYNDETPDGKVQSEDGHTKGVVAANNKYGFWLVHSVPKYPNLTDPYIYPRTGSKYGQTFLCVTFNSSQIDLVGEQLIFNEPNVYTSNFAPELMKMYPSFLKVINKSWRTSAPYWNEIEILSREGVAFRSFAKGHKFAKDLYIDFVAPFLEQDLLVESWRHGTGNLPSNCTRRNKVWNVSWIKIDTLNVQFHTAQDHSKWATSYQDEANWICVGDINRASSQRKRGGGTLCQQNRAVAKSFNQIIKSYESCS